MGIMDFIKGELLEIIEWTDDSRDTLSWRFPDEDKAIKNGAQLIVRESQVAQFVYLGEFGDTFKPGKHTLTTDNIPVLTKIKSWPYGFNSPFKADVYFVVTRLFTGNKWGTSNPVMLRDSDFGIVRVRAFGTYDFRIVDAEDVPARSRRLRSQLPARRVRRHDALAHRQHLHRRDRDGEDSGARRRVALHRAGRGVAAAHQPGDHREVRPRDHQLHRRERVGAAGGRAGDRQAREHGGHRQPERLREVSDGQGARDGCGGGGPAGTAAELAVGFGLAQQMMRDGFMSGHAAPTVVPPAPAAAARRCPSCSARRKRRSAGRVGGRRDGGPRVRRSERQEDRLVVADLARGVEGVSLA